MRNALLVIDIQNDYFPGGAWTLEGAEPAGENAAKLLVAARDAGVPVFHIRHEALQEDAPFLLPGTPGADIHKCVEPVEDELIITKNERDSFEDTDLGEFLEKAAVQGVIITGMMTDWCVTAAARTSSEKDYSVLVVGDACAAKTADVHVHALSELADVALITTTETVVNDIEAQHAVNEKDAGDLAEEEGGDRWLPKPELEN